MLKQLKLFTTFALVAGNANFQAATAPTASAAPVAAAQAAPSLFAPLFNPFKEAANKAISKVVESVTAATVPAVVESTEAYALNKLISLFQRLGTLYTKVGRPIMTKSVKLLLWIIAFIITPKPATPAAQATSPATPTVQAQAQ